jgi:quercetin dioxygenase-like cupin family protein
MPELIRYAEAPLIERGDEIVSVQLTPEPVEGQTFIMGTTLFPPGTGLALHCHNTVEQVTLLEGEAMAEVDGRKYDVVPYDTSDVPAGVWHRWVNIGDTHMRILWVYGATYVTRTFFETGETIDQFGMISE